MKKHRMTALAAMLALTLSITGAGAAAGLSQNAASLEKDITYTIDDFLKSDGADAEQQTDEMVKQFLADPGSFLQAMSKYSSDTQQMILKRIASYIVGGSVEERVSFEDIIYSSSKDLPYIGDLKKYYTEALAENVPQEPTVEAPMYDIDTVEHIVDSYLASDSEGNEEFFHYLFHAYQAEPELIGAAIMQHSKADLQTLVNGLARVYKAKGISISESSKGGPLAEQISEALYHTQEDGSECLIKWFRRVFTRYDKPDTSFLAFVYIAEARRWLP